ncbi:MAG TPA: phenylalanine--tRNA ligase subunit alpha [Candidatus Borkfalkia faecavium]|uniref:Phenylalanine--tRNA ligase alpha subunit n=1 Tax=Candidatus Borkfalkia faecavium TaxID=2838508 RepID=A0A9D1W2A6_9FIRM|nr:phenylalanine--tRNA ligase subunit alpha [Candidatus Borkfalkia faecavium]
MKEKIESIRRAIGEGMLQVHDRKQLFELKMQFLGKTGEISALSKGMRDIPPEQRPEAGKLVGEIRTWAEEQFAAREEQLKTEELSARYASERVDVTMPARFAGTGSVHPVSLVRQELIDIFAGMGFDIYEGPEIEQDYYNFQALNIPADHPARDMQDTFFIGGEYLLRSQTSSGQIRVMENKKPPIKVLSPGRVYRSDSDATHSPMFHQMEGLVVDRGITLNDLKGCLDEFARRMFDEGTKTRLRPSYFPFTEPSVEVDLSCCNCGGKGCRVCKGTGWIEVLGAGVVNRRVLENCGIDPDEYTGFAFGMGLERIAMIKYGITDIRLLFEGDVRFLRQFKG